MNRIKPSKHFLLVFITSLLAFIIAYPLTYNALVTKDSLINHSYKDFLLRYTNSPRLIIDSGSNSNYGINSNLLEKELGILTINLADNGSIPLQEKLYRLEKFSRKGDVILLPLEWPYYFSTATETTFFIENIIDKLHFYYTPLPWTIKLKLIFNTPFYTVLRALIIPPQYRFEYVDLIRYKHQFKHHYRGDNQDDFQRKEKFDDCNRYIFRHQENGSLYSGDVFLKQKKILSSIFKENIKILKKLQHKGVSILLTWPVVVGENCYAGEYAPHFQRFVADIKNYLAKNNLIMIGEPEDSHFEIKFIADTPYHVIPAARDIRTQKLIGTIKKSNANSLFNIVKESPYILTIDEIAVKAKFIDSLNTVKNREQVSINKDNSYFLASGWYPIEPWGVWSKENESILYIKLAADLIQHNLQLIIENNLYGTQDKTTVLINDKKLGDYVLEGRKSIVIPRHYLTDKSGLVKIQFNHIHVKSPLEYGENQDTRKLKFGLKSLQFSRI